MLGHACGRLPELQRLALDRASAGCKRPLRDCRARGRAEDRDGKACGRGTAAASANGDFPSEANRDRLRRANSMLATLRHRLLMDRPGGSPRAFAMGVRERDPALDSPLYVRGELDQPGEVVARGLVRVLYDDSSASISSGSGRRELAEWLASASNPLTARVIVNRVWLHLFGRGLVATPDNFGSAGARPSHPELLDLLAVEFTNDDWSIKGLVRRIVLSRAYGLDSAHDDRNFEADPDNTLIWRMSKLRLVAEAVARCPALCGGAARERAADRVGGGAGRRRAGALRWRRRPGRNGCASIGLPAGGPRPGARVACPVRLSRPEPGDRQSGPRRPVRHRRSFS